MVALRLLSEDGWVMGHGMGGRPVRVRPGYSLATFPSAKESCKLPHPRCCGCLPQCGLEKHVNHEMFAVT